MATILGLDTSQMHCSVCIYKNEQIIFEHTHETPNQQVEILPSLVQRALVETHLTINSLDALAPTVGPGSFTGVRIALTFVKGMAVATKTQIIGTSTLDAMAFAFLHDKPNTNICALINARRDQFFANNYQWENNQLTIGSPSLVNTENLDQWLNAHNSQHIISNTPDALKNRNNIEQATYLPNAISSAQLVNHLLNNNQSGHVNPIYVREADAIIPIHKGL